MLPGERAHGGDEAGFVAWLDEQAADAVVDILGRRGHIERDDRQAGRERFERDVAEGIGHAREEEQVGRRVVMRQRFAVLRADELRAREFGGQAAPQRTVAHHDHLR